MDNTKIKNTIILKYIRRIEEAVLDLKDKIGNNCLIAFRAEDKDYKENRFTPSIFREKNANIRELELNAKNILMEQR